MGLYIILGIIQLLLIVLKVINVLNLSWWLVIIPLYIAMLYIAIIFTLWLSFVFRVI